MVSESKSERDFGRGGGFAEEKEEN
ncbi:uncharacterized protein G2W53_026367 [Senna tora]|uniref:Uncharacterized protein n=1 Tax=Senna tora TaxID=362788 RepID=A0A834WFL5_9FABA|nr:uncharacterized protein G2W53_026367 [Senna tora]